MEKIKDICKLIKESTPAGKNWTFDERFNSTLISFDAETSGGLLENMSKIFENKFDSSSIKKATKEEKQLVKSMFGLSKGQLLFTFNEDALTLFSAWWPWNDGETISLRVGIFTLETGFIEGDEFKKKLNEWFLM